MAAPIKNAEQVKQILTETLQKKPEMYAHFVNYVLVDAYTKLGQLAAAMTRIQQQVNQVVAVLQAAQPQPAQGQEAQAAQPAQPQIKLPPGMQLPGVTTPAIPQAQASQNGGNRAPSNGLPPGFTGNSPSGAKYVNGVRMSQLDGTPLSPEEQEIEERMDAATS